MTSLRSLVAVTTLAVAPAALADAPAKLSPTAVHLNSGKTKELVIDAPAGAKVDVKGENVFVLGGEHFEVAFAKASAKDFKSEHDAVMRDDAQKPSKVEADTATLFHWQNDLLGEPLYQFQALVKVDKDTWLCRSSTLDNQRYTKADTDQMIKACQSLRKK